MTTIVDNGFARISKETILRNPSNPGALTGNDIAYNSTLTINEKISTITGVDLTAGSVANIPSGNIVSTNVQDALNELQTDVDGKAPSLGANDNYVTDAEKVVIGNTSGTNSGDNAINILYSGLVTNATHTGDVTGATALTIANDAVTNAKMANMATKTYKGRTSAATGDPEDVSVATLKTDLSLNNVDNTSDTTKNSAAVTLTNKRITKRVETVASSATPASNTNSYDITKITGLATAITSLTSGLTGTPSDGDLHMWSFTDNGTARSITPGASFENSTVLFPTTTVISTRIDVLCEWNTATSKWRVVAYA